MGKFTWVDHPTLCISAPYRAQHQNENMPTSQSLDYIKYQHKITKSCFCFGTDGKGRVKETLLYISRFMDTILVTQIVNCCINFNFWYFCFLELKLSYLEFRAWLAIPVQEFSSSVFKLDLKLDQNFFQLSPSLLVLVRSERDGLN